MKLIQQSYDIIQAPRDACEQIEIAGRTCYKSEDRITNSSSKAFVKKLVKNKHTAMIEFAGMTVRFITNRGLTHEAVRHRLCSFAQESTRYCDYSGELQFITPVWFETSTKTQQSLFTDYLRSVEKTYIDLRNLGWRSEQAREVLPNALATEICVFANFTEWSHIFKLRCSKKAHPQMRALMLPLFAECKLRWPEIFDAVEVA